jgi:hypothetical protein
MTIKSIYCQFNVSSTTTSVLFSLILHILIHIIPKEKYETVPIFVINTVPYFFVPCCILITYHFTQLKQL